MYLSSALLNHDANLISCLCVHPLLQESEGLGFVSFLTPEAAALAAKRMDWTSLYGKGIFVAISDDTGVSLGDCTDVPTVTM